MRFAVLCFIMVVRAVAGSGQGFQPSQDALKAMEAISTDALLSHIRFLSDDLLEGRAPGSRGDKLARAYIASQMQLLELEPGADNGTYFQRLSMLSMTTDPTAVLEITGDKKTLALKYRTEFVGVPGVQKKLVEIVKAPIIFVGYGIVAPEQHWDDYKDVDVKGKILLMLNNDPSPDDSTVFGGKARTYYGRWTYKYEIAAMKEAAGVVIIHTSESAGYGWNVVQSSWTGEQFELMAQAGTPSVQLKAWTSFDASKRILNLAGKDFKELQEAAQKRTFRPIPLNVNLSTVLRTKITSVETANVIGVLRGGDQSKHDEAVVYTAHHDHLGIGKPIAGDSIYNGALDNASGISGMLDIARMFTSLQEPPKRSIVFIAVAAEEAGLIGSEYYTHHPTFPLRNIAAEINIDGINIFGKTRDIVAVGLGKSSVDNALEDVAGWQGRIVKGDQFPEQGSFYRSDQFNFAKAGIPCLYLDAGVDYIDKPADFGKKKVEEYIKENYHQPSDEIGENWDLSGAVQDVQLTFLVGLRIANNPSMPVWNKGDEFEAARLKSHGK